AANPFMFGATVAMLVRKAASDVSVTVPARPDLLQGEPAVAAVNSGREPAGTLAAVSGERPADAATSGRDPAGTPGASEREPMATTPTDMKCETGLASCRKWIALQERKAQLLGRGDQR